MVNTIKVVIYETLTSVTPPCFFILLFSDSNKYSHNRESFRVLFPKLFYRLTHIFLPYQIVQLGKSQGYGLDIVHDLFEVRIIIKTYFYFCYIIKEYREIFLLCHNYLILFMKS